MRIKLILIFSVFLLVLLIGCQATTTIDKNVFIEQVEDRVVEPVNIIANETALISNITKNAT